MDKRSKILVLVEGEVGEARIFQRLIHYFELETKYEIVPYKTNIYILCEEIFKEGQEEFLDIQQVLIERAKSEDEKTVLKQNFTDTILIFDLDPQDRRFDEERIRTMQNFFCESSDMGKLYINYPMSESFYHMMSIPDPEYNSRRIEKDKIRGYKSLVRRECFQKTYDAFATSREELNIVISQNLDKALLICGHDVMEGWGCIDHLEILKAQLENLKHEKPFVYILCTCVMYIYDYNSELIKKTPS